MTGLDILKKIRAEEKTHKTPFILITSDVSQDDVLVAHEAGVSSYILKPFSLDHLSRNIKSSIENPVPINKNYMPDN